jgi:hypothetical protein
MRKFGILFGLLLALMAGPALAMGHGGGMGGHVGGMVGHPDMGGHVGVPGHPGGGFFGGRRFMIPGFGWYTCDPLYPTYYNAYCM